MTLKRPMLNIFEIKYFIIMFLFLYPDSITYNENFVWILKLFALGRYLASFYYIGKSIVCAKKTKKNIIFIAVAMSGFMMISAFKNGTIGLTLALSFMTIPGFFAFNQSCFSENGNALLKTYKVYLSLIIGLHFLLVMILPNGLYESRIGEVHFLGGKNGVSVIVLLLLLVLIILKENTKKLFLVSLIMTMLLMISNALSGVIALVLVTLYFAFSIFKFGDIFIYFKKFVSYVSIYLVILFFITVILNGSKFDIISSFTNMLGKDATFSGRKAIWAAAISYILNNPLWGIGQGVQYDVWNNYKFVYSAHNSFLNMGVSYGLISTFLFVVFIYYLFKIMREGLKKYSVSSDVVIIISVLILIMMFEALETEYYVWALFGLAYSASSCISNLKLEGKNEYRNSDYMV